MVFPILCKTQICIIVLIASGSKLTTISAVLLASNHPDDTLMGVLLLY